MRRAADCRIAGRPADPADARAAAVAPVAHGAPSLTPVPFDAEIAPILAALAAAPAAPLTPETLPALRGPGAPGGTDPGPGPESARGPDPDAAVRVEERLIPGPAGAPDIELTVLRPAGSDPEAGPLPILVNFHGGGMIVGHRSWEHDRLAALVAAHRAVGVNVEYRLAPEDPFPAGIEDAYAATAWAAAHAAELGGDPDALVVMGGSAGGAFAAAVALMARDRGGPAIAGQLLLCPMLDNTNTTVASRQYDGIGTWTREANLFAWRCVLGEELAYSPDAPAYAAPARVAELSGLPPAFIEVGSAEMFRDEDADYARRIWEAGGEAELHVWSGGCHGFDRYAPDSEIARAALASRDSWLRRVLRGVAREGAEDEGVAHG
ncbi:alpha/beta hydrolase [Leucobacter allii]|uniref:alpha/beta hydrolase n=1 Tax=Leucobacter allii TaxID=2932247 RepID=UPI001FD4AA9E|nr:alpha/beta hydrolase fold domain-containing protein [Leucobacter allii]UOR03385.1 alpha/beta hydrolase [Leucobacter allii]